MKKMRIISLPGVLVAVAALTISACSSDSDDAEALAGTEFAVELSSDQEVPPVVAAGASGIAQLVIDTETGAASGTVTISGLTGDVAAAHIHSGFAGENGGVLFPLEADAANNLIWVVPADTTLDAPALATLANGGLYINVHTAANAAGEIRGQIVPSDVRVIRTDLSGAQEVPAVTGTAAAAGVITVNDTSGEIWATVVTSGLDDATAAHIHAGEAGVNGDVLTGLEQDAADVTVWRSVAGTTLTAEDLDTLDADGLYYNVHTPAQPAGAVRGQILATQN